MEIPATVRAAVPDWVIVMGIAGVVGAVSAILSVGAYREVSVSGETALPIGSEVRE